jgi:hypothetical protein
MSLISEFCRREECPFCDNPACEHLCHKPPVVEISPAGLALRVPEADINAPSPYANIITRKEDGPDPLVPRPKGRQ